MENSLYAKIENRILKLKAAKGNIDIRKIVMNDPAEKLLISEIMALLNDKGVKHLTKIRDIPVEVIMIKEFRAQRIPVVGIVYVAGPIKIERTSFIAHVIGG